MGEFITDVIYGSCLAAFGMIILVILHRIGIIKFNLLEWFRGQK